MKKFKNDKCVRCGKPRPANSPLCVDCLVATVNSFAPAHDIAEAKIKDLEKKNKKLTRLCERLLDHITSQVVYAGSLEKEMQAAWQRWQKGV